MPKTGMEPIRTKQVIYAVLKCVAEKGIDRVTLDKTASFAGVSKGVVTYYFHNKKNLLLQSFKSFLRGYMEMSGAFIESVSGEVSAVEMLYIIGKATLGLLQADQDLSQGECKKIIMQIYSRMTIDRDYKAMMNEVYSHYLEAIVEILEYGMSMNEFQITEPRKKALQLMALLDGLVIYSIMGFQGSDEDHFEKYRDFVEQL